MTIQDILSQVKSGKLSMEDAQAKITAMTQSSAFSKDSVSLLKSGKIRVNAIGGQCDLSANQALAVLAKANEIRALVKQHVNAETTVKTETSKRGGKEEQYEMHFLGPMFAGYRSEAVAAVKNACK